MSLFHSLGGQPLTVRGSGTTLGSGSFTAATFSQAVYYVTDLGGSSASTAAIIKVLVSGTVVWQVEQSASGIFHINFDTPLKGTKGQEITATIDGSGTSIINMSGFRTLNLA